MGSYSLLIVVAGFWLSLVVVEAYRNAFARQRGLSPLWSSTDDATKPGISPLKQVLMRIDCNEVSPDEFTDLLFELGVASVSIEMLTELDVLNEERTWAQLGKAASWDTAIVKAHIPNTFDSDALLEVIRGSGMPFELKEIAGVADKDWVTEVQKDWKPEQVTDDLSIRFPWHEDEDVKTPYQLTLEAGAAFGTGGHQTTRLCCKFLEKEVRDNTNRELMTLLDYGCGSGILALVGLFYGCKIADGTDIDLDSLHAARRNAINNGISNEKLRLFMAQDVDEVVEVQAIKQNNMRGAGQGAEEVFPSVSEIEGKQYDIVVANILAPILIALAEDLWNKTAPGGKIALSGVIAKQGESVAKRFTEVGFQDCSVTQNENDWVLITGQKP